MGHNRTIRTLCVIGQQVHTRRRTISLGNYKGCTSNRCWYIIIEGNGQRVGYRHRTIGIGDGVVQNGRQEVLAIGALGLQHIIQQGYRVGTCCNVRDMHSEQADATTGTARYCRRQRVGASTPTIGHRLLANCGSRIVQGRKGEAIGSRTITTHQAAQHARERG